MPSLKSLKNRITSVKSTQKITKAMKMVAASKLKRATDRAEQARPYAEKLQKAIANLASSIPQNSAPELLGGRRDANGNVVNNRVLVIVTGSDRGLCGGFNGSIIRAAKLRVKALEEEGKEVDIVIVGKKPKDILKTIYVEKIVDSFDATKGKQVQFEDADHVGKLAIDLFEAGKIDSAEIIFNKFVNALVQTVTLQSLIPLQISEGANDNKNNAEGTASYEYEPDEETILKALLPQNISVQVFKAFLENAASEQGARMTAMDNATKNAGEMIYKLSLIYNRTRQATITKELIEIISGAEAL